MNALYIKFLRADGTAPYSDAKWSLPTSRRAGKWMPRRDVVVCESGYHATTLATALEWIDATAYLLEYDAEPLDAGNKVVGARARLVKALPWDDRAARLFAADCAERVLPIFEGSHPTDNRPRLAIRAARDFANGRITAAAREAAGAAARNAAGNAAGAAAGNAERRWQAWQLGRYLFDGYMGEEGEA